MEARLGLGLLAVSYLLGAIPFGLVITHLMGIGDIRRQGSGNIGATNVLRTAGKIPAAIALLLDMLKGALPILIAIKLAGEDSLWVGGVALAAFIGHLFPIYLKFQGGKGVATALGIWLAWHPLAGVALLAIWLVTAKIKRISSLAALTAFGLLPSLLWLGNGSTLQLGVATLMVALIFWKHKDNIRRLLSGDEPKIGQKEPSP